MAFYDVVTHAVSPEQLHHHWGRHHRARAPVLANLL
jgi:hypothetical protein